MCGICGIVDLTSSSVPEVELVELRDDLVHRGPDDAGLFASGGVGLAARRLAILDLSPRGHMPMSSEDGELCVTYNGEIYNYPQLRELLEGRGHRFRSDCDTEVLLHAYREWGDAFVERLTGMFAFAIWDARQRRLFAARDRLGVKPFFYVSQGSRFIFASEAHGLYRFRAPSVDSIDAVALDFYLGFGHLPPDRGFVEGISKLPPAHTLVLDHRGVRLSRYWQVRFRPTRRIALADALDELDRRLRGAVARRLRSDVPLGCFLSGGIDSGLVTAMAAVESDSALNTFSVGFSGGDAADDERPLARLVAQRYGTNHRDLTVGTAKRSLLAGIMWHMGEPFADIGALPMLQISQEARKYITVALSGDGGDESFAGYPNVRAAHLAERMRRVLPGPLRSALALLLPSLGARLPTAARAERWFRHYVQQSVLEQSEHSGHWPAGSRREIYTPASLERLGAATAADIVARVQSNATDLGDAEMSLFTDLHLRLAGRYLTKVDIASNQVSLEVRSPFLDHDIVEFAAQLPLETKLLGGRQKGLLRRLAERYLPSQLITEPKRGFAPDLGGWLRGDWSDLLRDFAENSRVAEAGLLRGDRLRAVAREHLSGEADRGQRLWTFLCLEIWWRLFVDKSLSRSDTL